MDDCIQPAEFKLSNTAKNYILIILEEKTKLIAFERDNNTRGNILIRAKFRTSFLRCSL